MCDIFQPAPPQYAILVHEELHPAYDYLMERNVAHLSMKDINDYEYPKELFDEK